MHKHCPRPAFTTADDIDRAIVVEIDEHGVLDVGCLADSDGRPFGLGLQRAGIQVDACDAALFPAGGDVGQSVAVDVGQARAVRAA